MRCESGLLVDIRKGDRAAFTPEAKLAAPLRTEADRKTDLAAATDMMTVKMLRIWKQGFMRMLPLLGFFNRVTPV